MAAGPSSIILSLPELIGLWRYPVKGMAGVVLDEAAVYWHGLDGDRRWAFVRPGLERSDFPWLTIRERSDLACFVPRIDGSTTFVRTPAGAEHDVADPALAAELGDGVRVIKQNRGVFDTAPLSLISAASVTALCERAGVAPDAQRFRPNLLIDGVAAFEEEDWVGRELRIGDAVMRVDRRDQRCVVTNVDPATGRRTPAVLKTIAKERDACLGVYGTTVTPGRVRVGDPVAPA